MSPSPHHKPALPTIGHVFTVLDEIDSTNLYAIDQLKTNMAAHGHIFFALKQWAGRGQMGKQWITEAGQNIILSAVIAFPKEKKQFPFLFSMAMALAAFDFFEGITGGDVKIKWPNDIYWRDRKAGGILIELVSKADSNFAVVGIGLNINQTKFDVADKIPVSLKQITGKEFDVFEMAKTLCANIESRYYWWLFKDDGEISFAYNACLYKRNQEVKLKRASASFDCTILGVNTRGELLVSHPLHDSFRVGEVTFVQ